MPFIFADPATEQVDFLKTLKDLPDILPTKYLKMLNDARRRVCETLLAQPASEALFEAIEAYIPHLLLLLDLYEQEKLPKLEFSWKAVLTIGEIHGLRIKSVEKKFVKCPSVFYEAIYLLMAYAFSLSNMAAKKVGQNPSLASETALNEAVDLYCRASGIFSFLARGLANKWTDATAKNKPPECTATAITGLVDFMLLEAQILGTVKAEKRGMSATTVMKLQRGCIEKYNAVRNTFGNGRSANGELSDVFLAYIKEGWELCEALLMKRFAAISHNEDKNGMAVACMTRCYNIMFVDLKKTVTPKWQKLLADNKDDVKTLLDKYVSINNHVTYDPIPPDHDILAALPQPSVLVETKPYKLPEVAVPPANTGSDVESLGESGKKTGFLAGLFKLNKDDLAK